MHNPWEGKKGIKLVGIEREILFQKFLEIIHSLHIKNLVNRLHIVINLNNTTKIIPIDQTNEEEIQSDITMTMLNNSFWWIFSTNELIRMTPNRNPLIPILPETNFDFKNYSVTAAIPNLYVLTNIIFF